MFGRVHVQAHDVFQFFHESGIARDFESPNPMRLQTVRLPYPLDGRITHPSDRPQRARAPLRSRLRLGLRGQAHDLSGVYAALSTAPWQIMLKGRPAPGSVALAPSRYLYAPHTDYFADRPVLKTIGSQQNDGRATRQTHAYRLR